MTCHFFLERYITLSISRSLKKRERNWPKSTFAKASGTAIKPRGKNWPIGDRCVPSYDPRDNCGTNFGSSSLLVSKVAKSNLIPRLSLLFLPCRRYERRPWNEVGSLGPL